MKISLSQSCRVRFFEPVYVVNLAACRLSEQVPVKCEKNPQRPFTFFTFRAMKKFFRRSVVGCEISF